MAFLRVGLNWEFLLNPLKRPIIIPTIIDSVWLKLFLEFLLNKTLKISDVMEIKQAGGTVIA